MAKINWKDNFQFSIFNFQSISKLKILNFKFLIFTFLSLLLIYTRFVNIGWGLPYPMHPDERNMAAAVQQLHCEFSPDKIGIQFSNIKECYNPHFFAYGQFPLYLGYGGVQFMKFIDGDLGTSISFPEAAFSLRMISAISSIITAIILYKLMRLLLSRKKLSDTFQIISFLIIIFCPVFIQFAHFGTTESLLILFYSSIIYLSLLFIQKKLLTSNYLLLTSFISGLALATKISSFLFLVLPIISLTFVRSNDSNHWSKRIKRSVLFLLMTGFIALIFSPHAIISFNEFISSMQYESGVALGQPMVFYTRQFNHTIPIIFQLTKIYPYALGLPVFIFGLLGMMVLSWKKKELNLLRFAFILVFLPNAFMFAKWTRFIAPSFPILIVFSFLALISMYRYIVNIISKIKYQESKIEIKYKRFLFIICNFTFCLLIFALILPGIVYLSIYQNSDVRFQATNWINRNMHIGAKILSETANVVDIPLDNKGYGLISFNFYDLDSDKHLQEDLVNLLSGAEYIIVPSRRIFKNHSPEEYPILNEYYQRLFSGTLGFKKVAEFHSYPKLNFQFSIFNFQLDFPDENAEETWTVFDHPVIRIFRKFNINIERK